SIGAPQKCARTAKSSDIETLSISLRSLGLRLTSRERLSASFSDMRERRRNRGGNAPVINCSGCGCACSQESRDRRLTRSEQADAAAPAAGGNAGERSKIWQRFTRKGT